ncbi:hypothetical protein WT83_27115 [Burkholderia territorii]|uniref:Uncharacterized protein n=1 Tax=Burkholderia territorii TaxID=1503055 RepID=A0A108E7Y5_9BURK|nr:hypothetical protein WT83_27115 [Burkholderia territorii]
MPLRELTLNLCCALSSAVPVRLVKILTRAIQSGMDMLRDLESTLLARDSQAGVMAHCNVLLD